MPTLFITGANRGIGRGLTEAYAQLGWEVHACIRNPDRAKDLKDLGVHLHRLDVTDGLQVANLAREMADVPIDLMINNAGVMGPRTGLGETDYDAWLEVLKVNTLAPNRLIERFADHVAASAQKKIVCVSSVMGSMAETTSDYSLVYRSSKAALNMVVRCAAAALAPRDVSVVAVHPGWVRTDMGGSSASISVEESVAGLVEVIGGLTPETSGHFFRYDGSEIPW